MNRSWLTLAAIGIAPFVPAWANAQPLFASTESIESTVANADTVVVGKLVEFGGVEKAETGAWRPATVAVEATLKGEHRERLRVRLTHPAVTLGQWKERSSRLLVTTGQPPAGATVIDLADPKLAVLKADFTVLRKPRRVIHSAKQAIRHTPGVTRVETFRLEVPREAIAGTKWAEYHGAFVMVPVDRRLEKRAHALVQSRDYSRRGEGARALRYFKSDANVTRVKALLDDRGWSYLRHAEENNGIEVRFYGVRQEAYDTLKYWGVNVEKPATRVEVSVIDMTRAR